MLSNRFSGYLFSNPRYFRIDYDINPYMSGSDVDSGTAYGQWADLITKVRDQKKVETVEYKTFYETTTPVDELPDIVFSANHGFPVPDRGYIVSNMATAVREVETSYFIQWAKHNDYEVIEIDSELYFEGSGDAKWHPERELVWFGYGYRSDEKVADELEDILDANVKKLEMQSEKYYHLDVCFEPLDRDTALVVTDAFNERDMSKIRSEFSNIISVPENDIRTLGGNCASIGDNLVLIDKRNQKTIEEIENSGFLTTKVDTGEFMKSGGSADCMFVRIP